GTDATVAAADSWAQNRPSLVMNPTRNTGIVAATVEVRLTAKKNSFQAKMMQISALAAIPGMMIGMITRVISRNRLAPSIRAASSTSPGTSRMNERGIHTAVGRVIAAYTAPGASRCPSGGTAGAAM